MDYRRIYTQLVHRAQERKNVSGYSETHHIIPRAHGGDNTPDNLVQLTAREHFLAHWLLWRIHRDRSTALAFRLLTDVSGRPRSRAYANAKGLYAAAMVGNANVSKRPEVRAKISASLREKHPYTGIKRPTHAKILKERGHWSGTNNPHYGKGAQQAGAANHMARKVVGVHAVSGTKVWETSKEAANYLGVSPQAVCQALRRATASKGWNLEYKL